MPNLLIFNNLFKENLFNFYVTFKPFLSNTKKPFSKYKLKYEKENQIDYKVRQF